MDEEHVEKLAAMESTTAFESLKKYQPYLKNTQSA
jgi:hypothetical protein